MADPSSAPVDDAAAAPAAPAPAGAPSPATEDSPAARLLYKDSVQMILTFLPVPDLRSANSVCALWHAAVISARQAETVRIARLTAKIRAGLFGSDEEERASAAKELRILSLTIKDRSSLLPLFLEADLIAQVVALISQSSNDSMLIDCTWGLTNVASSSQTSLVVKQGAIPPLVRLLSSANPDVQEQAVWCLSNIAGDSSDFRDLVLEAGAIEPVLSIARSANRMPMLRTATWCLSNLCRGKPQPHWDHVRAAVPVLANLLVQSDEEILADAAWCLGYLCDDDTNEHIQAVVNTGVAPRLVELLSHPSSLVRTPVLRAVGFMVTGDEEQTQTMIESGLLPALLSLLSGVNARVDAIREAAWTISNGPIEAVFEAGLFPPLIALIPSSTPDVLREVCFVIFNAIQGGQPVQLQRLDQLGVFVAVCGMLQSSMPSGSLSVALDCIDTMSRRTKYDAPELHRPFLQQIEDCNGRAALCALSQSASIEPDQHEQVKLILGWFDSAENDTNKEEK